MLYSEKKKQEYFMTFIHVEKLLYTKRIIHALHMFCFLQGLLHRSASITTSCSVQGHMSHLRQGAAQFFFFLEAATKNNSHDITINIL